MYIYTWAYTCIHYTYNTYFCTQVSSVPPRHTCIDTYSVFFIPTNISHDPEPPRRWFFEKWPDLVVRVISYD